MNKERLLLSIAIGLNLTERRGYVSGTARSSAAIGLVLDTFGRFWLGGQYHKRAMALADQCQDVASIGLAHVGMQYHEYALGNWQEAIEHSQRATEIYWEAGDVRKWGSPIIGCALLYNRKGMFDESLNLSKKAAQIAEEGADIQLLGWALHVIGLNLLCIGKLSGAIAHIEKSIELLQTVPDYFVLAIANGDLGRCYLRLVKIEQGLSILEENFQSITRQGLRGVHMTFSYNALAAARLFAAMQEKKPKRTKELKKAYQACKKSLKQGKRFIPGLPEALRLQGTYQWFEGKPAIAQKFWQRSVETAERLGAKYEEGLTCLEIGKRMGDLSLLERAETIFSEIGAKLDLDQTLELLGKGGNGF